MEEEYLVAKYLKADAIIHELQQHREETVAIYRNATLSGHVVYDADRVHMVAPRVDTLVIDMMMRCEQIDRRIDRWKMRKRLFNQYVDTLTSEQLTALMTGKASAELTEQVQAELYEIETYVAYHFHEQPPELRPGETTDARESVTTMLAFLGG